MVAENLCNATYSLVTRKLSEAITHTVEIIHFTALLCLKESASCTKWFSLNHIIQITRLHKLYVEKEMYCASTFFISD